MGARDTVEYSIEPWSGDLKDLRGSFDCGADDLNSYLKRQASQDIDKRTCALFTALNHGSRIAGFYATVMFQGIFIFQIHTKLPKYPLVAAVLLDRLAFDLKFWGKGVGELLLLDTMKRALYNEIAWWAMIVYSKEESRSFYLRYGFCTFDDEKYRLFIPLETIRKAFEENQ